MKTETKHTPGPWKTSTGENLDGIEHRWISNGERFIADIGKVGGPVDSEANARLIAAAPELFSACMAMLEAFDISMYQDQFNIGSEEDKAIVAARDAIAKAAGN